VTGNPGPSSSTPTLCAPTIGIPSPLWSAASCAGVGPEVMKKDAAPVPCLRRIGVLDRGRAQNRAGTPARSRRAQYSLGLLVQPTTPVLRSAPVRSSRRRTNLSHSDAGWSSLVARRALSRRSQIENTLLLTYFVFPHSLIWYNARR
jgi:hypothetical protein